MLRPDLAALVGWGLCGLVNLATSFRVLRLGARKRLLLSLFDLGQFVGVGILAALVVFGFRRVTTRRAATLPAAYAAALGVAAFTLSEDLSPMADRISGNMSSTVVLWGVIAAVTLAIPACIVVGWVMGRLPARFRPVLRALGVAGGIALQSANAFVLRGDYPAVHLFVAWIAASLIGASIAGAALRGPLVRLRTWVAASRVRQAGMLAPLVVLGAVGCVLGPPMSLTLIMLRNSAYVFQPYLGRLRTTEIELSDISGPKEFLQPRGDGPAIAPSEPPLLPKNAAIIVVSLDALRADIVNGGKHDELIPTIAKLRDEGVSFAQARAPGSKTVYTLSSLFAGTYFSQQYWTVNRVLRGKKSRWPHEDETRRFPRDLTDAGVSTILLAACDWMVAEWGIARGFETEHWVRSPRSSYAHASSIMSRAISELRKVPHDKPVFLFTHLLDPHSPYSRGKLKTGSEFDRYLSELEMVDEQLERLVSHVAESPRADRTLFVITSDHGEAFGEHNSHHHGTTVYDEVMHVPLIVSGAGLEPRVVEDYVSLIDLGPTVLDLLRVPTPHHHMGQSLAGYLRGETPELARPIACETRLKRAMVFPDGIKVIIDDRHRTFEIYDLKKDPKELENLIDERQLFRERVGYMEYFFSTHRIQREGYRVPWRP